uniref:Uncharacterized protein n=1 Tax=Leersia perrieri TaxID=77586 RepID=A0A0D9X652_9ORYZ
MVEFFSPPAGFQECPNLYLPLSLETRRHETEEKEKHGDNSSSSKSEIAPHATPLPPPPTLLTLPAATITTTTTSLERETREREEGTGCCWLVFAFLGVLRPSIILRCCCCYRVESTITMHGPFGFFGITSHPSVPHGSPLLSPSHGAAEHHHPQQERERRARKEAAAARNFPHHLHLPPTLFLYCLLLFFHLPCSPLPLPLSLSLLLLWLSLPPPFSLRPFLGFLGG